MTRCFEGDRRDAAIQHDREARHDNEPHHDQETQRDLGQGGSKQISLKIMAKNVLSILSDGRELKLIETFNEVDCDALLISETWRKDKEEIRKPPEGHMFLGSGWQGGHRGVATILHKRIAIGFKGSYPASERAGAVDVDIRGAKVRFLAAYLPDSSYDDADV